MLRQTEKYLSDWKDKATRKPLILRGARQVGKSFVLRKFGQHNFDRVVEINFEKTPDRAALFQSHEPKKILPLLEAELRTSIEPGRTLLFLDEIQDAPEVLSTLRYFHEELPSLAIVGAGSLLDFALYDSSATTPVGRIEYAFIGPMTFEEFLLAAGDAKLVDWMKNFHIDDEVPPSFHRHLLNALRTYLIVGGMPEAVKTYFDKTNYSRTSEIHHAILNTYRDDFNKYRKRVNTDHLQQILKTIPNQVGHKVKYSNISRELRAKEVSATLFLFEKARIIHRVLHSSCSGVPISALATEKIYKIIFLDTGLLNAFLGVPPTTLERESELTLVHQGSLTEQFVGQQLLSVFPPFQFPQLHYWVREEATSSAEIDYVIQIEDRVIPVEVKAGKSGSLKSLQLFLIEKKLDFAVRLNSGLPSIMTTETSVCGKERKPYRLLSIPLYFTEQLPRLVKEISS